MRQQIASAIAIVVQVSRMSDGTRKVINISEITGMEENVRQHAGDIQVQPQGRRSGWQGGRGFSTDADPSQVSGTTADCGHFPAGSVV